MLELGYWENPDLLPWALGQLLGIAVRGLEPVPAVVLAGNRPRGLKVDLLPAAGADITT